MIKKNDIVEYRNEKYKVIWIGKTKSGKYMSKLRQNNSTFEIWALTAELKEFPKTLRISGFTHSECEDCNEISSHGSICSKTGNAHL